MVTNPDLFFSQLVLDVILLPVLWFEYLAEGVNPQEWPECRAKGVALEFQKLSDSHDVNYAAGMVSQMAVSLNGLGFELSSTARKDLYRKTMNRIFYSRLASEIMANPEEGDIIIAKGKKSFSDNVNGDTALNIIEKIIPLHEERIKSGAAIRKIQGWEKLSTMIGGFNPGRLIVIVAKTGVGKTNLALNLARQASKESFVVYYNMEMDHSDIIARLLQAEGSFTFDDWTSGRYVGFLSQAYSGLIEHWGKKSTGMWISDGKALSIEKITSSVYFHSMGKKLGAVIVDYDQKIISSDNKEEWKSLQSASEKLEELAKEIQCPVILLAQGDDDGRVVASKRIKQHAATLLQLDFDAEQKFYFVRALKNRFGKQGETLRIHYQPEKSLITEGDLINHPLPQPNNKAFIYGN